MCFKKLFDTEIKFILRNNTGAFYGKEEIQKKIWKKFKIEIIYISSDNEDKILEALKSII